MEHYMTNTTRSHFLKQVKLTYKCFVSKEQRNIDKKRNNAFPDLLISYKQSHDIEEKVLRKQTNAILYINHICLNPSLSDIFYCNYFPFYWCMWVLPTCTNKMKKDRNKTSHSSMDLKLFK